MATVLVVDDRSINREFLAMLLGYAGHEVIEAADGNEALARIRSNPPDLVITDLMMPIMDGAELTRRLRDDPATAAIPVMFYTATFRVYEAHEIARDLGVDVVLPKPSEPQAILDAVGKLIGTAAAAAPAAPRPVVDGAAPLRELARLQQRLHVALDPRDLPRPADGDSRIGVHALSLRLAALLEVGLTIAGEHDAQRLLDLFCRAGQDLFGVRYAGIVLAKTGQRPHIWAASGLPATAVAALAGVDLDHGAPGDAVRDGAPVCLLMLEGETARGGLPAGHPPVDMLLFTPIGGTSGVRGVLYLADKVNGKAFNDEDEQFATMLCAQLAMAYGGLELLADARKHAGRLEAEVAERRRTEAALRESELRFRQIADNVREVFFVVSADYSQMLYISPAYESVFGRSLESVYADPGSWMQAIHPDDLEHVAKCLEDGTDGTPFEYRILRPDRSVRWLRDRLFAVRDESGSVYRVVGITDDITEEHYAAMRVRESEARFRQIAENVREVFFLVDADSTQMLYVSPAYEEIWGRSCASLYADAMSWSQAIHPDDLAGVQASVARQGSEGGTAYRYRIVRPDGTLRWISTRTFGVADARGTVYRLVGIAEDVTEQELAVQRLRESKRRMASMLANVKLVSTMLDEQARITYCNEYLLELTGWRLGEVLGKSWFDVFMPADIAEELWGVFRSLLTDVPDAWHHENEILTRDGRRRLIRWNNSVLRDEAGRVTGTASIGEDITERVEQERRIARLSRIRAVTGAVSSAMLRLHERDALLAEACRIAVTEGVFALAWASVMDPATNVFEIAAMHGGDEAMRAFLARDARLVVGPDELPANRVVRTGGPVIVNDLAREPGVAPVRDALLARGFRSAAAFPLTVDDRIVAVVTLFATETDFFDAQEVELLTWLTADLSYALASIDKSERLDYLAYHDALTGLANARSFGDRLGQFVVAAHASSQVIDVVAFDVERFAQINDAHGRPGGDAVLCEIGVRLRATLEEPYSLARLGADTFAIAMPRRPESAPTRLYDTVLAAFEQPFGAGHTTLRIAVQAGLAVFPEDGADATTLVQHAETALHVAKATGARHMWHSAETNARMVQRLALEEELRVAVERQQFVVHYQPRIDMMSGELVGAEALLRWQHPERGLVLPAEFIEVLEETGLIVTLGAWVIDTACAQQAAWLAAGLGVVPVAVNLCAAQLGRGDLLQRLQDALRKSGIEPKLLDLELTESAIMNDVSSAAATLQTVRKTGIGLALDDFGTGYSSLAHLKRFPFQMLKIDRSFITDVTSNAEDAAIATAIIAMARRLGLKVCAEGVENAGQFTYLRAQGCNEMQGFFFSPAIDALAFAALLVGGRRLMLPTPESDQPTLLVVDDEQGVRSALVRVLRRDGYRILTAASGTEGLELLAVNPVQVIISDQRMPGMSGTAFLSTVTQLYPDTVRIVLSGYTDLEVVTDAVNRGSVFKFLTKPWDDDLLREQVRDAFRRHRPSAGT